MTEEVDPVKAAQPTKALPGTAEKVRVLRDRASTRCPLFHPHDNYGNSDEPPGAEAMAALKKLLVEREKQEILREARGEDPDEELPPDIAFQAALELILEDDD